LILSGGYIGYLPQHYAKLWTEQNRLKVLLVEQLSFDAAFHMIVRSGQSPHPQINAFLRALQESAAPFNQAAG